ncbi:hypothetical protein V8E36_005514 [Tilletia maclaganii]
MCESDWILAFLTSSVLAADYFHSWHLLFCARNADKSKRASPQLNIRGREVLQRLPSSMAPSLRRGFRASLPTFSNATFRHCIARHTRMDHPSSLPLASSQTGDRQPVTLSVKRAYG